MSLVVHFIGCNQNIPAIIIMIFIIISMAIFESLMETIKSVKLYETWNLVNNQANIEADAT